MAGLGRTRWRPENSAAVYAVPAMLPAPRRAVGSRWSGVLLLAVAVIAALVLPRVISPGWSGTPAAIPLPAPPPVGGCVRLTGEQASAVPCTEPHDAEVIRSWGAGLGPVAPTLADKIGMPINDVSRSGVESQECAPSVGPYIGRPDQFTGETWQPIPPNVVAHYVVGQGDPVVGALRWSACVVSAPTLLAYTGVVQNALVTPTPHWPAEFGTCIVVSYHFPDVAGCERAHRIELLGFFAPTSEMVAAGTIDGFVSAAALDAGCVRLAALLTGVTDPTYGGLLRITQEPVNGLRSYRSADSSVPLLLLDQMRVPMCLAEVVGDATMNSTIIGLGNGPPVLNP